MNFSNQYMGGTRTTLSNLRRLNRMYRITTGKRPWTYGRSTRGPRDTSNKTIPILPGVAAAVRLAMQAFFAPPPAMPSKRPRGREGKGKR